jgi:hypothetical protein
VKKVDKLFNELPTSSFKWTAVDFGKFEGKKLTLPQIILTDPDWFFYMVEIGAFTETFARQADDIAKKARKIRIPGKRPGKCKVLNYLAPERTFSHFDIVKAKPDWFSGSAKIQVTDFIDLSISHRLKPYDKAGAKRLIKGLKSALYGRTNVRLTKRRCEEFFADPDNFG